MTYAYGSARNGARAYDVCKTIVDNTPFYTYTLHMNAKELLKLLKKDGWYKVAQCGSHLQLEHATKKGKVTIPMHNGDIPTGTLKSVLKQAGISI